MLITIIVFVLILSVLVLVHEAGHLFVAKKIGIKVEEFGFGFPPRLFGRKIGETLYSVNWIPIGGFVKLYGEDEAGGGKIQLKTQKSKDKIGDEERAFHTKSVWQRAVVILAGVVMNAVLAALIFYIYLGLSGFRAELPLLSNYKFLGAKQINTEQVVISEIAKDSPADKAGIKAPAKVISVNGVNIGNTRQFIDIINKNKGQSVEISWSNFETEEIHKTNVIPRINHPKNQGALGVGLFPLATAVITYETPVQKVFSGIIHPYNLMAYNLNVMGNLIKLSFKEKSAEPISAGLSGPVGIASVTGSILEIKDLKEKILNLLNLAGLLSISLAFFNVLPIPALDGGRLFFIIIEGVTGKKVNQNIESMIHTIGMIILLGLLALITYKDIGKIFMK